MQVCTPLYPQRIFANTGALSNSDQTTQQQQQQEQQSTQQQLPPTNDGASIATTATITAPTLNYNIALDDIIVIDHNSNTSTNTTENNNNNNNTTIDSTNTTTNNTTINNGSDGLSKYSEILRRESENQFHIPTTDLQFGHVVRIMTSSLCLQGGIQF